MQIYRDHGVQINNPHVYIVEDGKQNNLDPAVVRRQAPLRSSGPAQPWEAAQLGAPCHDSRICSPDCVAEYVLRPSEGGHRPLAIAPPQSTAG